MLLSDVKSNLVIASSKTKEISHPKIGLARELSILYIHCMLDDFLPTIQTVFLILLRTLNWFFPDSVGCCQNHVLDGMCGGRRVISCLSPRKETSGASAASEGAYI